MDVGTIWNIVLSAIVGLLAWVVKGKLDKVDQLEAKLSLTREEMARDHVTRAEFNTAMEKLGNKIDTSFERLEAKIDRINERGK